MRDLRAAVGLVLAFCLAGMAGAEECAPDRVDIRQGGTVARFTVEVVDTPASRAQGLMHRESLGMFAGMLFIYERPQPVAFWMKNTLIPLDMLFIDETGLVRNIKHMATPLNTDPIPGGDGILEVLEINGGLAADLGLDIGAEVRHPSFAPETAAWPCGE